MLELRGPNVSSIETKPELSISRKPFGTANGAAIEEFTLKSSSLLEIGILTWGGTIRTLKVPDRSGVVSDIVLGFDGLAPYCLPHPYFGCLVGRMANRIARGEFSLDGERYHLAINNPPNHLHGGIDGFHRRVWSAATRTEPDRVVLTLSYLSPDGEEGYPGELAVTVEYSLTTHNTLEISYSAHTNKATPCNLTSHSYFNLAGHDSGDVRNQHLKLVAGGYTPTDETLIPLGSVVETLGTPFDFHELRPIGEHFSTLENGYDHNFVVDRSDVALVPAAEAWDPKSGRFMEIFTTEPGIQLYTAGGLHQVEGKSGALYNKFGGFCLETQHHPDSINQPQFPSVVLKPGELFSSRTVHRFGIR